ncbi:hypothetical protein ACKKBG_A12755 [Auxenochlorella protothecoides x Auxenochlorella symbiontica]
MKGDGSCTPLRRLVYEVALTCTTLAIVRCHRSAQTDATIMTAAGRRSSAHEIASVHEIQPDISQELVAPCPASRRARESFKWVDVWVRAWRGGEL